MNVLRFVSGNFHAKISFDCGFQSTMSINAIKNSCLFMKISFVYFISLYYIPTLEYKKFISEVGKNVFIVFTIVTI